MHISIVRTDKRKALGNIHATRCPCGDFKFKYYVVHFSALQSLAASNLSVKFRPKISLSNQRCKNGER